MLFGRDAEWGVVGGLLDRVPAGLGGALVLRGPVGAGKSALLAAAVAQARGRGMRVMLRTEFDATAPAHLAGQALLDAVRPGPVLIAVEDAQWLDQASWEALAFMGRRLGSEPVVLLIAVRDGARSERRLAVAGLPELPLGPLAGPAAAALLDQVAPALPAASRERVLADAGGNPLALKEFSVGPVHALEATLGRLPPTTRLLLEVAAFNDGDALDEILAAAPAVIGDIEPAVDEGLVSVDDGFRLRWAHPLVRMALRQATEPERRAQVHTALAEALGHDPDRRLWHRAATATGPDEALAGELAESAVRLRTLDPHAALATLERAAELSAAPRPRADRLLAAVEIAEQAGAREALARLAARLDPAELGPAEQARLAWIRETALDGTASQALPLAAIAGGDADRALESLLSVAIRAYMSNSDDRARVRIAESAEGLGVPATDARLLCLLAAMDPVGRGPDILRALRELRRRVDIEPVHLALLGSAATSIGAFPLGVRFFAAATTGLRALGRLGTLTWALAGQSVVAALLADTRQATAAADEARSLAAQTGRPMPAQLAGLALAQVEALRGNASVHLELEAMPSMLALVDLVRGNEALASGRAAEAFDRLTRVTSTGLPAFRFAALGPLAEAASRCDRLPELASIVDELEPVARTGCSPVLDVNLAYARAVLNPDDATFAAALAADLSDWPFERARLQLAYGTWLRRHRRTAQSRPLLSGAAAVFHALGATAWPPRPPEGGSERLTAQEAQVARLAAEGLSNREIAERLFLSPRTVTTHLSRIFPKLGITTRRELPDVLENT